LCGILLISASTLLLEISLTRYFSFHLWFHYAFMIISIALLGLSGASTALALLRRRLERHPPLRVLAASALACAAAILVSLPILGLLSSWWTAETDASRGWDATIIGMYWLTLFVPFFFAGATLSWAIRTFAGKFNTAYAFDLVGAALGCLLAVVLLSRLHPEQALAAAAVVALASAICFASGERQARALVPGLALAGLVVAALTALAGNRMVGAATTPTKGLARDLQTGARIVASRPSMTGRVDVLQGPGLGFSWGLGGSYRGRFPEQLTVRIDGDALTTITRYDGDFGKWAFTGYSPATLPFIIGRPRSVLVIGPGGGMDVVNALGHGASSVVGVEINHQIIDLVRGEFGDFAGQIYDHPAVRLVHSDGRNYIESSDARYDLVQLTFVDTFAALASGALSLSEDFLYTREAFEAYVHSLSDRGVLAIGMVRAQALSLSVLTEIATRDLGLDLGAHLFIAHHPRKSHSMVFVFSRRPLAAEQVARGIEFVERAGLGIVYAPGHEAVSDAELVRFLGSDDPDAFVTTYPGDIRPETDDKPFFFRRSKWTALLGSSLGGRGNLLIILGVAVVFAIGLIVVPLALTAPGVLARHGRELRAFAFIGLGFIMLEMALLVKFSLFLGHPVRSLAVVLFSMLFFAGLGSAAGRVLLGRGGGDRPGLRSASALVVPFALIAAIGLGYGYFLPQLFSRWMGLAIVARVGLAIALLAPLSFLMGMPLPISLALLRSRGEKLVLWAWALNGVASVIGSILTIVLAHGLGYRATFLLAAACYLLASLSLLRTRAAKPVAAGV
jgi:hypothetical protein